MKSKKIFEDASSFEELGVKYKLSISKEGTKEDPFYSMDLAFYPRVNTGMISAIVINSVTVEDLEILAKIFQTAAFKLSQEPRQ